MTKNIVRNDGMTVYQIDVDIVLAWHGEEERVQKSNWALKVTWDYRIELSGYFPSDPMTPEVLREKLSALGLEFEEYLVSGNAMSKKEFVHRNTQFLFGALGIGDTEWTSRWQQKGDVVHTVSNACDPYDLYTVVSVTKEISRRVNEARRWINQTFPGFLRRLKLSDLDAVEFFEKASRCTIVRFNVGETTDARWQGGSYFGSGGASGSWKIWGAVSEVQETASHDNGFVRSGATQIHFDGVGALYTYAGDSINGGRTFWRELYIADGNSVVREPAKVETSNDPLLGESTLAKMVRKPRKPVLDE